MQATHGPLHATWLPVRQWWGLACRVTRGTCSTSSRRGRPWCTSPPPRAPARSTTSSRPTSLESAPCFAMSPGHTPPPPHPPNPRPRPPHPSYAVPDLPLCSVPLCPTPCSALTACIYSDNFCSTIHTCLCAFAHPCSKHAFAHLLSCLFLCLFIIPVSLPVCWSVTACK